MGNTGNTLGRPAPLPGRPGPKRVTPPFTPVCLPYRTVRGIGASR